MSADAFHTLVHAYVDGELAPEERADFEAHVLGCEGCRRALADEQAMVAALRGGAPLYETPAELRGRVEGLFRGRGRRRPWAAALAAAAAVALLAGGLWLLGRRGVGAPDGAGRAPGDAPASAFASLAADTHLRFARGQLPLEVLSDRPEVVSRWFEGRVPFRLQLPDYPVGPGQDKPYRLEGGRLVAFRDDYAAYVAYRMADQPISLIVTSVAKVAPEGGSTVRSGALTFHLESVAGLKVITWSDKGLTYALASDVGVEGSRSCLVCHGSAEERRRIEPFPSRPST